MTQRPGCLLSLMQHGPFTLRSLYKVYVEINKVLNYNEKRDLERSGNGKRMCTLILISIYKENIIMSDISSVSDAFCQAPLEPS